MFSPIEGIDMSVFVGKVSAVVAHPDSDKLDLVTIRGFTNVANRPAPNTPRYSVGDHAIVFTENLILPDNIIKHLHMWDYDKNKGGMAGSKGNRTKGRNVGGIRSEVALHAVKWDADANTLTIPVEGQDDFVVNITVALEEYDLAALLGITDYVPQ
jgi:hypothetical protein